MMHLDLVGGFLARETGGAGALKPEAKAIGLPRRPGALLTHFFLVGRFGSPKIDETEEKRLVACDPTGHRSNIYIYIHIYINIHIYIYRYICVSRSVTGEPRTGLWAQSDLQFTSFWFATLGGIPFKLPFAEECMLFFPCWLERESPPGNLFSFVPGGPKHKYKSTAFHAPGQLFDAGGCGVQPARVRLSAWQPRVPKAFWRKRALSS